MEEFFKETIMGIILLGAVGSVLAASILWVGNRLIKHFAPKVYSLVVVNLQKLSQIFFAPGFRKQIHLYLDANSNKLNAYYSVQKSKVVILATLSTWVLGWLAIRIKIDHLDLYSVEVIALLSLWFFLVGILLRSYACLMVPLLVDIDAEVEAAIEQLGDKQREELLKIRANKSSKKDALKRASS